MSATLQTVIFSDDSGKRERSAIVLPPTAFPPEANTTLTLSYGKLQQAVAAFRKQLEDTDLLDAQTSVSMSLVNSLEFVGAFLAVGDARCIAAPLNPTYTPDEAEFYLSDSKSRLLLVHAGAASDSSGPGVGAVQAARKLQVPIAEVFLQNDAIRLRLVDKEAKGSGKKPEGSGAPKGEDTALLLHTSGTTGRPKAVPLTHTNLTTTMRNIVATYNLTHNDRSFLVMPLFHVHGLLAGLLSPLASAGSLVIPPKFAASSFWKEFIATKSTWYTAVPTIHQILLRSPHPSPIPNIRFIRSCSSALSATTHGELEKAFKAPVLEAYAMTEAAHQMTSNPLPPGKRKPGTVGLGQGVEVRILDFESDKQVEEGEVCIRGANVTPGYLNNEKANASSFTKDRFFRTGDRGRFDADGFLVLTGRLKELINRGGEKISPLELDSALLAVQGVGEAVAFGVPDSKYGEVPWAAVVPKSGAKLDPSAIQREIAKKLGKFKIPEKIFITDSIPKTATGKVQRRKVAEVFLDKAKSQSKL